MDEGFTVTESGSLFTCAVTMSPPITCGMMVHFPCCSDGREGVAVGQTLSAVITWC